MQVRPQFSAKESFRKEKNSRYVYVTFLGKKVRKSRIWVPWDEVPGYSDGGLCTRPGSCDLGGLQIKVVSEPESPLDIFSKVNV